MSVKIGQKGTFTGWHMLGLTASFFLLVIAVNMFMAYSAISTWTGLVVENSYVASQEFNTKQATARARDAAGWAGALVYENGALRFSLTGGDGKPVVLDGVRLEINRPIGIKGDRTLDLLPSPDGTHMAQIDLDSGVWIAEIVAKVPGAADYEHHARLIVDK